MRIGIERPTPQWCEVDIRLSRDEIEGLIAQLAAIRDDPDQHFHLTSESPLITEAVQVTFSQDPPDAPAEARLSSLALPPGTEI